MSVGAILIDQPEEGQFRATCSLLPEYEIVADSEEVAREAMREAIALHAGGAAEPTV